MKKIFVCMIVLVVASASLQALPVSVVTDPNLRIAVINYLNLDNSYSDINPGDTARPDANDMNRPSFTFLEADSNGISDLTGLEYATNLKSLRLVLNSVSDVNKLSNLTKLVYLNLNDNHITDINSLEKLTGLKYLYLSRNDDISDVNAIRDMNSLAELGLSDVGLIDISPLAELAEPNKIKYLWLSYNFIEDINALTNYKNLTGLTLYHNPMNFESWTTHIRTIINNKPSASIGFNVLLNDRSADMNDLRIFASKWLRDDCSWSNSDCGGTDFDESGNVTFWDFAVLAEWWMYQP